MAQRPDWLPPPPRRRMSDGIKVLLIIVVMILVLIVGLSTCTALTDGPNFVPTSKSPLIRQTSIVLMQITNG